MKSHQETLELLGSLDPFVIFETWLNKARSQQNIKEPNAMLLSTTTGSQPHSRVVLLKEMSAQGFIFYTNYQSHKGQEITSNPHVALNFYWDPLFLQIRIEGLVEKVDSLQSEAYWATRPRGSQISQWISQQSTEVASRMTLEQLVVQAETKFEGHAIPCPPHWGGYLVRPTLFEFWTGRDNRLHDRIQFIGSHPKWQISRLSP